MKFFFTAAIQASDGGAAPLGRERTPPHPPADRGRGAAGTPYSPTTASVEILNETGVDIARRTVAKYREAMRIPSSSSAGGC